MTTLTAKVEGTINGYPRAYVTVLESAQSQILLEWICDKTAYSDIRTREEVPAWPENAIN